MLTQRFKSKFITTGLILPVLFTMFSATSAFGESSDIDELTRRAIAAVRSEYDADLSDAQVSSEAFEDDDGSSVVSLTLRSSTLTCRFIPAHAQIKESVKCLKNVVRAIFRNGLIYQITEYRPARRHLQKRSPVLQFSQLFRD